MKHVEELTRAEVWEGYALTDPLGNTTKHRIRVQYSGGNLDKPVVYASDMSIIIEATLFLRDEMKHDEPNSKLQAASALKLLYVFCELYGCDVKSLTRQQARTFVEFLRGTLGDGLSVTTKLITRRCEKTVADYLTHVRNLIRYLEVPGSPLLDTRSTARASRQRSKSLQQDAYDIGAKTVPELTAPKSVDDEQYGSLLSLVSTHEKLRDRVMIRLMREHGLRIGEVLGLTLEDIGTYLDDDGLPRICVEIRNRLSDDPSEQRAKTAMKVHGKADYETPAYAEPISGYQTVSLGYDLGEELLEYVELAHFGNLTERARQRREEGAGADKVTGRLGPEQGNYYVFLNTRSSRLRRKSWNSRIRSYYVDAGIPIDRGRKEKNLSHRLRHGYCGFLKRALGLDEYQVMVLMRHSSLESQKPYDNPTPQEILQLQERINDDGC